MKREIDLQRRDRNARRLDRMKVGPFAGIGSGPGASDPIADLAARSLRLDHRFSLVTLAESRYPPALDLAFRQIGHVDIEQPRSRRMKALTLHQFDNHFCRALEMPAHFAG